MRLFGLGRVFVLVADLLLADCNRHRVHHTVPSSWLLLPAARMCHESCPFQGSPLFCFRSYVARASCCGSVGHSSTPFLSFHSSHRAILHIVVRIDIQLSSLAWIPLAPASRIRSISSPQRSPECSSFSPGSYRIPRMSFSQSYRQDRPSTADNSGRPSQPSMAPRDPPIAPRKSACYVPRKPRPPTPDHAPEFEQRVAPPAHLEERRPLSDHDRRDTRDSREGHTSHPSILPLRQAEPTLPPCPRHYSFPRPERSPPYRPSTTSDRRASDQSRELRLSDTPRQTNTLRPGMLPTPPPSAPRGPRAEGWPVARKPAPSIPPFVRSAPLAETRETHRPSQDDRISAQTDVRVKQEVIVKQEIIEIIDDDGRDRPGDEVTSQPRIGAPYKSDGRQGPVEDLPLSPIRPRPAILTEGLENNAAEHAPENTESHVAVLPSLPPGEPYTKPVAPMGGISTLFKPIESIEALDVDYKQFKHSFEVLVPAKYNRMSQKAQKAFRMMQLQIALARDESGKPTRLVRCGKVRRKGFRKLKIFWMSIKSEEKQQRSVSEKGRSSLSGPKKGPAKVAKRHVSRQSSSTSLSPIETEEDDDDDYNSEDAQSVDERPGRHAMPKFAGRAPAYDTSKPLSIKRTRRGGINTRGIALDDLPNTSFASVPSNISSHSPPSSAPHYRTWTGSVRVLAERRDRSGQPTRVVKLTGITDGKMVLRWAPLVENDDMVDVFGGVGECPSTRTGKRRRRASDTSDDVALPSTLPEAPLSESPGRIGTPEEAPGNDDPDLSRPKKFTPRRRQIIKTPAPTPTPTLEPAGKVVAENLVPADESARHDTRDILPVAAGPRSDAVTIDAAVSAAATPPEPSKVDPSTLHRLESALENALNDIDRWTEMLERHPERRHIIENQLKRTQGEVFRLDAEITVAKS